MNVSRVLVFLALALPLALCDWCHADVPVDRSRFQGGGGVEVRHDGEQIVLSWPVTAEGSERGRVVFDLRPRAALIERVELAPAAQAGEIIPLLKSVDPVTFVTVGVRENAGKPPAMSVYNVFFDNPAKRPYSQHRSTLDIKGVRVSGRGGRATVAFDGLRIGPFAGALEVSVYAGARLVHVEAVVRTDEANRAFVYDAGLVSETPAWRSFAWVDTEGKAREDKAWEHDAPVAVRHRAIIARSDGGSVACFPPPHQYFFPRDYTDNQKTVWAGKDHRNVDPRAGFGIRQTETGGGNYAPWINAPAGTMQRLGVFYLLTRGDASEALRETLAYTHGDRFPTLPGRVTFTSHWHMAITIAAMREIARGQGRTIPDFVRMFKDLNVNIVHLAEFHGEGHPRDPGATRLAELKAMFQECRRLSDDSLLFLPGEEANVHLGSGPGRHPGHWLYLFPRPVYWTMTRASSQPFSEVDPTYGLVYHVRDTDDMVRLLHEEHGLAWTAHPRIKASNWAPDESMNDPFYRDPHWLGGAWKAMPSDLSEPRLGRRVLDLLDDMANHGEHKYVPGEVDVFTLDHTHELYGHMNINYLALDHAPGFDEPWTPVLDALRAGKFFVTTGEVLLTGFTVGGKTSGETLDSSAPSPAPSVKLSLEWTFPLRFAEVVSGDGRRVHRERIDLSDTPPFGKTTLVLHPDLSGKTWVRVEAWDVAANGTFSQPIWLQPARVSR